MHAYSMIRDHPRLVARGAQQWKSTAAGYLHVRYLDPDHLAPIDQASRFVFLNRHCFNGVYRTNRDGAFNVPMGSATGSLPSEAVFVRCATALRNATLKPGDFERCLATVKTGDFVYLDPPYTSRHRRGYGEYGYDCFGAEDEGRLLTWLRRLDALGATFVLSYTARGVIHRMPRKWHRRRVLVRRHVAGFAQHRRRIAELLVSNSPLS